MTTKTQLQNKIQELESELQSFKQQLSSCKVTIETASVGDLLEDYSIVIKKENGLALIVSPKFTEVYCFWSQEFPEVYDKLKEHGFNPSQWFIPTKEQLERIDDKFSYKCYWSSTEYDSTNAWSVHFGKNITYTLNKTARNYARAFRCVTY